MYNEDVWNIYHEPTSSKEKDTLSDENPETYSKSDDEFSNSDIQNKGKGNGKGKGKDKIIIFRTRVSIRKVSLHVTNLIKIFVLMMSINT